jgi:hypothetical protein
MLCKLYVICKIVIIILCDSRFTNIEIKKTLAIVFDFEDALLSIVLYIRV